MQKILSEKLHQYLQESNPELLLALEEDKSVSVYVKEKISAIEVLLNKLISANTPAYIIEECCMAELIKELRPSKYSYLI